MPLRILSWLTTAAGAALLVAVGAITLLTLAGGCEQWWTPAHATEGVHPANLLHADPSNFRAVVLESDVPVLVDFYAEWCPPCKRLAPILAEFAAENPGAKVVKIDVDESRALADEYGVHTIPSLKVFQHGTITCERRGLLSKSELRSMLGL